MSKLRIVLMLMWCVFYSKALQIGVVGSGYVGLTMAAVFAQQHSVCCIDTDIQRITELQQGKVPFYEPELDQLVYDGLNSSRLLFSGDLHSLIDADYIFICVGTPCNDQGKCDISLVETVVSDIALLFARSKNPKIVCVKSTIAPGTMDQLCSSIQASGNQNIHLVYNPEFMREGSAIHDIYTKNPVILGVMSTVPLDDLETFYKALLGQHLFVLKTNYTSAELVKYSWNAFLAMRIAFVNELAVLARSLGADINDVVQGFAGTEYVLPARSLKPGPGFGGSCFPKDTISFAYVMQEHGINDSLVHRVVESNSQHITRLINDMHQLFKKSEPVTSVAVLGLSFKANTSDIRKSAAIDVINALLQENIQIHAYDPQANEAMKKLFPDIVYYESPYAAVKGVDAVIVLTEWDEIKYLDLRHVAQLCKQRLLVDARNLYDPVVLQKCQFSYLNMGKQS